MKYKYPPLRLRDKIGIVLTIMLVIGAITLAVIDSNQRDEQRRNTEYIYTVTVNGVEKSYSSREYTIDFNSHSLLIHLNDRTCIVTNQYTVTTVDHSKVEK